MNRLNVMILASFTMLVAAVHTYSTVAIEIAGPLTPRAHALPTLESPERDRDPDGDRFIAWLEPGPTTRDSRAGDAIVARLERAVWIDGRERAPAGATVVGHVLAKAETRVGEMGPRLLVRVSVLPTNLARGSVDSLRVTLHRG